MSTILLGKSYQQSAQHEFETSAKYAIRQVKIQLEDAISDSKSVSYDGAVRNAYRTYLEKGDAATLYQTVNDYLNRNFLRNQLYKAVFVSFWDTSINANAYILNTDINSYKLLQQCQENVPKIHSVMKFADTDIRFIMINDDLYLARNLLDSHFKPYASIVMMFDPSVLFKSLEGLRRVKSMQIDVDNSAFKLYDKKIIPIDKNAILTSKNNYKVDLDGHKITFIAELNEYNILKENSWLVLLVLLLMLMVLPLLFAVIALVHHHITEPIEVLVKANQIVQQGNRGYTIEKSSPNIEFTKLYDHFNSMSTELKNQFERSYLEQQAAQKAQIKALQSQINPHFLNNTLEIINWEARLADNQRVSDMIEALSTMLGAALDRRGRTQIPLKEELGYVDAYLYIISVRLGDKFHTFKEIDDITLDQLVPRLILQPIVENAVQHDITENNGGNLWVRSYEKDEYLVLEVEHDGTLTKEDKEKINAMLADNTEVTRVGLKNVNQRVKLIYGKYGSLTFDETDHGTIMVRITFPMDFNGNLERSPQE